MACLDFGENILTTELTRDQLNSCRSLFHICEEAEIEPVGLRILGSGIDDAVWFKFEADVPEPGMIFHKDVVPEDLLTGQVSFYQYDDMPQWWDTRNRIFTGGTVTLESGSVMKIGYQQEPDRIICYIYYHEM